MIDQDGKLIARPQPDPIAALREIAPEWATRLSWTGSAMFWNESKAAPGNDFWQSGTGSGLGNNRYEIVEASIPMTFARLHRMFGKRAWVIVLPTGTAHLQSADGTVTEVTRAEWEKMP